jgi:hypothetical protein
VVVPAAPAPPKPAAEADSTARDAVTTPQLLRGMAPEILSPSGTRWRISNGQVQRSTTLGQSWEGVALSATISAGYAPVASVVWFVGAAGAIFLTTDGTHFERVPFTVTADLVAVAAMDARQATVTTADGRRFRTTDRGLTWTPL